jgi:hypothetical protein
MLPNKTETREKAAAEYYSAEIVLGDLAGAARTGTIRSLHT